MEYKLKKVTCDFHIRCLNVWLLERTTVTYRLHSFLLAYLFVYAGYPSCRTLLSGPAFGGLQCLVQEHFKKCSGGVRSWTAEPRVDGRPLYQLLHCLPHCKLQCWWAVITQPEPLCFPFTELWLYRNTYLGRQEEQQEFSWIWICGGNFNHIGNLWGLWGSLSLKEFIVLALEIEECSACSNISW